jgi:transposase-like protein
VKNEMNELKCPNCGSTYLQKYGYKMSSKKGRKQRYQCQKCGYTFTTQ